MRHAPSGHRAYWSSGGEILTRRGWLDTAEAGRLEALYRQAEDAAWLERDHEAAAFCHANGEQLRAAVEQAALWRRAGWALPQADYQRRREPLSARYCNAAGVSTN
jgi:hypothetical protein